MEEAIRMIDNINLYQGDCLELLKDIPDGAVDMILCDLPYGTTNCAWDSVIPFEPLWEQYERIIRDDGAICLFGQEPFSSNLRLSNLKIYRYEWIWKKPYGANYLIIKKQPFRVHETISVFSKKPANTSPEVMRYFPMMREGKPYSAKGGGIRKPTSTVRNFKAILPCDNPGERYPESILSFDFDKEKYHPTQKPVALLEYLIKTYTRGGEVVLDNCMGSGSTGVACVQTGRKFIGMELTDEYFEIAKRRIADAIPPLFLDEDNQ